MDSNGTIDVRVSRHYDAPPERVFDAWLDPAKVKQFLFATPEGTMVRYDVDPRVGGTFCLVDRRNGKDVSHEGEYIAIDRPHHLAFEFGVDGSPRTRVAVDVRPGDTGSELTLVHEMPAEFAEYAEKSRSGWAMVLAELSGALASK